MSEDRCICCGAVIPEGVAVCPSCLVAVKKREPCESEQYYLVGGMRGSGKVFHLEQLLKYKQNHLDIAREEIRRLEDELDTIKEQRDMWKQLYNDTSKLLKWMMRKKGR